MLVKEVILDEMVYLVEIEEVNQSHFCSQKIAVARAFAKTHSVCHHPLLQRLANIVPVERQDDIDKTLLMLWSTVFK